MSHSANSTDIMVSNSTAQSEDPVATATSSNSSVNSTGSINSPNVWKRHLLLLQENAPKPKAIVCNAAVNNRPPFYDFEYHGPISREIADKMLSQAGDGAYLVRESQREVGTYTLCIRFDNVTKNYKLFYDGQHYVGEKRFDTLDDLVADGLISMFVEKHAADYIRRMAEETVYEESPYSQYQKRRLKEQIQRKQRQGDVPDVIGTNDLTRHRNLSQGSNRSLDTIAESKAHRFKTHTFKGPHWCDYCRNYMWGLVQQGVKCEDCGFAAHRKCAEKVLQDCRPELKYVRRMFAVDLTTLTMAHNVTVPPVVEQCIAEIESRGLDVEGLYRVSGSHEDVEKLRTQFDTEGYADLSKAKVEDVHTLASLLKLYLRLLPQPLITYSVCRSVTSICRTTASRSEHERIKAVRRALQELPPAHYRTLRLLVLHLSAVAQQSHKNKMTLDNLSRIFVLTLMCPYSTLSNDPLAMPQEEQSVLCFILTYGKKLFGE